MPNVLQQLADAGRMPANDPWEEAIRQRLLAGQGPDLSRMTPEQRARWDEAARYQNLPFVTGQNELLREALGMEAAAAAQSQRAQTGVSLLNYRQRIAEMARQAEQDPFRLGEHLLNLSQLPQGTGNPIQALLGAGTYIEPQLPTVDPRYEELLEQLLGYANPNAAPRPSSGAANDPWGAAIGRVIASQGIDLGSLTPQARAKWDAAVAAQSGGGQPRFARGGTMTLQEPVAGVGLFSRRVKFLAGEAGPERLEFTPGKGGSALEGDYIAPRRFAEGGDVDIDPDYLARKATRDRIRRQQGYYSGRGGYRWTDGQRQRWRGTLTGRAGDVVREGRWVPTRGRGTRLLSNMRGIDPNFWENWHARRAGETGDGATAPGDNGTTPTGAVTPAQAAAISLGRGLESNPFAHGDLVSRLLAGEAPLPGSVTGRFMKNIDPMILETLLGVAQGFGVKPRSFAHAVQQFRVPGYTVGSVTR